MPMRVHYLQHVPFEGPAGIADWAAQRGHTMSGTRLYAPEVLPQQADFDWLVLMGGPMGVYEEGEHPWLVAEKALLRDTIAAQKPVVGVCLGAQLIAEVLGARVFRNLYKEIGWFPIDLTEEGRRSPLFDGLPQQLEVFHWHGDTFDLPPGAVHLVRSKGCAHQAFLHRGRVLGLQFHIESTPDSVRQIVKAGADDLVPAKYVQSAERILAATTEDYARINQALFRILDRLPIHE
jgi:GMP synthase-like glutamine amidotransferase